jgi:hypothetical protein
MSSIRNHEPAGFASPAGRRYEAMVPDTLDLTQRAELAVNGLIGSLNPSCHYESYVFAIFTSDPPWAIHYKNHTDLVTKLAESLPMMRAMSGSTCDAHVDEALMGVILEDIGEDGLYYARELPERPWHEGGAYHKYPVRHEDFSTLMSDARLMLALMAREDVDGLPIWREATQGLAEGLCRIAILKDNYAYYPDGGIGMAFSYPRSGWYDIIEPTQEEWGGEGTVTNYYGTVVRALAHWAGRSGDEAALDRAARLTRYLLMPRMWGTGLPGALPNAPHPPVTEWDHAHFRGHFHGRLCGLRGMLEYATLVNDTTVKQFVRDGYEFCHHRGIPRVGFFGDAGRPAGTEGCTIADMTALAIRLSDAGMGDYWDDVDEIVRNHLIEQQIVDADLLHAVSGPESDRDNPFWPEHQGFLDGLAHPSQILRGRGVVERLLGTFFVLSNPTSVKHPWGLLCCTSNCTQALYYAWEGIVRHQGDTAHVNLLLNRASPWVDVDSYLPYEGKAIIHNRTVRRICVRVPRWVPRQELRAEVSGAPRPLAWVGNYLVFDDLRPGDDLVLQFPVVESIVHYTIAPHSQFEQTCRYTLRGSTVVDVSPRDHAATSYPLYLRQHMQGNTAPMRSTQRFIADRIITGW